jgi:hypothetical protein
MRCLLVVIGFCAVLASREHARADVTFTDWTSVDTAAETASGSLGPITVSFSGSDLSVGVTDNTFTAFNSAAFTPPLATTDTVEFRGQFPATSYTLGFSSPVTNPRLHLATLASTLDFGSIPLTKLSGDADFVVAGSTVDGEFHGSTDSNGTILLTGTFTSISFSATFGATPNDGDGIDIQVGADLVPEPATPLAVAAIAPLSLVSRRRRHRR